LQKLDRRRNKILFQDPLGEKVNVRYAENLATFVPHTTGYFKVFISDYHGPLLGSPFNVLVNARSGRATSGGGESAVELDVVESSGIKDCVCHEETKFLIRSKDLELDVQIKSWLNFSRQMKFFLSTSLFNFNFQGPKNSNLVLKKRRTGQGFLQVFYTPEMIGKIAKFIFNAKECLSVQAFQQNNPRSP
jgi:hypothetical protein